MAGSIPISGVPGLEIKGVKSADIETFKVFVLNYSTWMLARNLADVIHGVENDLTFLESGSLFLSPFTLPEL